MSLPLPNIEHFAQLQGLAPAPRPCRNFGALGGSPSCFATDGWDGGAHTGGTDRLPLQCGATKLSQCPLREPRKAILVACLLLASGAEFWELRLLRKLH